MLLQEAGVARIEDVDLAHHLANDHLEVLIVDLNALHAVNVLHLVDDVLLNGCRAHDVEDVGRGDGTVGQRCAGAHVVVLLYQHLLRQGHQVLLLLAELGDDADFAVAALVLAEVHLAVDFGNDGGVRRVAGLEQLGDTGQTARDVAGAAGAAGNLDDDVAGLDVGLLVQHEVGAYRQRVCLQFVALCVNDADFGVLGTVAGFDDHLVLQTRLLVDVHTVGNALDEVLVVDLTTNLADEHGVEGVPFANHVALLDLVAIVEVELCAVGDVGVGEHHAGRSVHDAHFGQTSDHHLHGLAVGGNLVGVDGA